MRSVMVRADAKGRLTLPRRIRKELGIEPGTTFAMRREGDTLSFAKVEDPFDGLARQAIRDDDAGRTRPLREVLSEMGIEAGGE